MCAFLMVLHICNWSVCCMVSITEALAFMLFGADIIIYLAAISKSYFVFPHKSKLFFILLQTGLFSAIFNACIVMSEQYLDAPRLLNDILGTLTWFIMIFIANYLYSVRINSLAIYSKFDQLVKWTPWLLLLVMLPTQALGIISYYIPQMDLRLSGYFLAIIFSFMIAIGEILLYVVLLRKILEILEYRLDIKRKLSVELSLSLFILCIFDILLIISKLQLNTLDRPLRAFTYLLRLLFLIRFYDDLLDSVGQQGYLSSLNLSKTDSMLDNGVDNK
eukprot:NODE_256_length_11672_cov_0.220168.p5 type:complete len:276 gc:universal NODE_256_length_11672_cov_0.220168:10540-9713(-)